MTNDTSQETGINLVRKLKRSYKPTSMITVYKEINSKYISSHDYNRSNYITDQLVAYFIVLHIRQTRPLLSTWRLFVIFKWLIYDFWNCSTRDANPTHHVQQAAAQIAVWNASTQVLRYSEFLRLPGRQRRWVLDKPRLPNSILIAEAFHLWATDTLALIAG